MDPIFMSGFSNICECINDLPKSDNATAQFGYLEKLPGRKFKTHFSLNQIYLTIFHASSLNLI